MHIEHISNEAAIQAITDMNLESTHEWWGSTAMTNVYDKSVDIWNAIAAFEGGVLIGWCVEFDNHQCHTMVKMENRRKGIGSLLVEEMNNVKSSDSGYCPWNYVSSRFYESKDVDVHLDYEYS